jgi:tetratricopeptide (TPR) repeat protein
VRPDYAFALRQKGVTLHEMDRPQEALQVLKHALKLDPNDASALGSEGKVFRALNRVEEANYALKCAITLDPDLAWAHAELGKAYRDLDRYEEALDVLNQALERTPDNAFALGTKGSILADIAEYQDSANLLDRATQLQPNDAWLWGRRGWTLEHLGREHADNARAAYEKAIELDSGWGRWDLWYHKGRGNILYLLRNIEGSADEYRWVIEQATERTKGKDAKLSADFLSLIGWCHYRLSHYDDALWMLSDALSLDARLVPVQFDLALVLMSDGHYGIALREYQRGVVLAKRYHPLRQRGLLGVALDDLHNAKECSALDNVKETQISVELLKQAFDDNAVAVR